MRQIQGVSLIMLTVLFMFCQKDTEADLIPNECIGNVKQFGAKGDGLTDDRLAIQQAIDFCDHIIFPKGTYLLASRTDDLCTLLLQDDLCPKKIIFEEGAKLKIADTMTESDYRIAVMCIRAKNNNIDSVLLENIQIDGNRYNTNVVTSGIFALEETGYNINSLNITGANIINVGWIGISTGALNNNWSNIYTENCGLNGIEIYNDTNKDQEHFFHLDGHVSIRDEGYSIDFSGVENLERDRVLAEYSWTGTATNISSINSNYGIKTAGYWDLKLSNVLVENSKGNGFFINFDAPNKQINIENMVIRNANNSGLALEGKTFLKGKNITVEGCRIGLDAVKTDIEIDSLLVDGLDKNQGGIRIGNVEATINNFTIQNSSIKDTYAVWLSGKKSILKNGLFINNKSLYEIIINEDSDSVLLKNLTFGIGMENNSEKNGIVNNQEHGKVTIVNCDFTNIQGEPIDDRTNTICITDCTGF